jgi:hypothetical protein
VATTAKKRYGVGQTNSEWAFSPYSVSQLPSGSYDPVLDAQQGAVDRGYGDLQAQTATANARDVTDYGTGVDQINRTAARSVADLTQSRDYNTADLGTAQQRSDEDYSKQTALLARRYQMLAGQQQQSQNAAGVLDGGAVLQAAGKRAANQATAQADLDAQRARANADLQTQRERLAAGFGTSSSRLGEDQTLQLGQLALTSAPATADNPLGGRAWQDRVTALTQAGREQQQYGVDTAAQKAYQATSNGFDVTPPAGYAVGANGVATRTVTNGDWTYVVDKAGKVISRKRRA